MSRIAFIACALLLAAATAFAATSDELWQDDQKQPGAVATTPTKPAEGATPKITGEPTQPSTSVVSNKPTADPAKTKPKPLLKLVGKPPLPRQFMRTPQASDFATMTSGAGGYSISLPRAFGEDPLATLPQAEGAMLVRMASDTLMCAVTVLDPGDTTSFNATQALPRYENAKIYWTWQQHATLTWNCKLSGHDDYHGDKMLFEAAAQQDGKTYQMLFVMPKARYPELLPQAVYALHSFKLN